MKRRRHRNTWRRDLDADAKQINNAWLQLEGTEKTALNRDAWRKLVGDLCPRQDHMRRLEMRRDVNMMSAEVWFILLYYLFCIIAALLFTNQSP
ncbi:hypothetical protein DPMN_030157 [Dreissena polymorpha]|uniref:Uncharacterized protein n=1 Tax=Dreissena polymorpha TaxID=45954 RepID=A0A9D4RHT0_DREPO|nr:hypothetical protein DPMN_030157 [Dreissena polymorpha]